MTSPSVKIENEKLAAHTPGPWIVESNGHYPIVRKRFRPDHHMDVCGPIYGYMYAEDEKGEQAANARLIAAAPEMYEALKRIAQLGPTLSLAELVDRDIDIRCEARLAISKAEAAQS